MTIAEFSMTVSVMVQLDKMSETDGHGLCIEAFVLVVCTVEFGPSSEELAADDGNCVVVAAIRVALTGLWAPLVQ